MFVSALLQLSSIAHPSDHTQIGMVLLFEGARGLSTDAFECSTVHQVQIKKKHWDKSESEILY